MTRVSFEVEFADFDMARQILCRKDEFVLQMTPYERQLRMQQNRSSVDAYLSFVKSSIRDWDNHEIQQIKSSIDRIHELACRRKLRIPGPILLIKTTGEEEWNGVYTRSNAIILPKARLSSYNSCVRLSRLLIHELYHIVARKNPRIRSALNRLIGFYRVPKNHVHIPKDFPGHLLTNPDSTEKYYFHSAIQGDPAKIIPLLTINDDSSRFDSIHELESRVTTTFLRYSDNGGRKQLSMKRKLFDRAELHTVPESVEQKEGEVFDPNEIMAEKYVALLESKVGSGDIEEVMLRYLRTCA